MALAVSLELLLAVAVAAQAHLNYYEDRRRSDSRGKDYQIYWNMPTFQCRKFSVNFTSVSEQWTIRQNHGDDFRGNAIALLYDPGLFPALLSTTAGDPPELRNGGVPQAGNLSLHLDRFKRDLNTLIPATNFRGIGIIDFEHWRPIWRQNWLALSVYKNYSVYLVHKKNPWWTDHEVEKAAKEEFEASAKVFMLETLRLAKNMRPKALWGYYGYPFCFNYKSVGFTMPCSTEAKQDNLRMLWLFKESTGLYPSLYLSSKETRNREFIVARIDEAVRVSTASSKKSQVYPYTWPKYRDANRFLNKADLESSLVVPRELGAEGALIWGSSRDVNTKDKCLAVQDYLQAYLGPTALRAMKPPPSSLFNNFLQILGKR